MKVLFIGPVGDFSVVDGGYGNAATGIYKVLKHMEENGKIESIDLVSTLNLKPVKEKKNWDVAILVAHPDSFNNPVTKNILLSILQLCKRRYLSVVWETVPLPSSWDWMWTSEYFTGFLAPSNFVGNQIRKVCKKPIHYYPHYIDIDYFSSLNIKDKVLNEDKFTVLCIGQHTKRKNLEESVKAFVRGLGSNEDCKLVIKYHMMSQYESNLELAIRDISKRNLTDCKAQIYTLTEKISGEEIVQLYKESSALLFITRGEGFGLPVIESISVGLPVIYSDWSSLPEVVCGEGNISISCRVDSAVDMAHHGYEIGSKYAYPSMSETIEALKSLYDDWKKDKKKYYKKFKNNRNIVDKKFGLDSIVGYLDRILNSED